MLDGSGDPHADIELGRHGLAGLSHLPFIWHQTGLYHRSRAGNRSTDHFGQFFEQRHGRGIARAASGDHQRRVADDVNAPLFLRCRNELHYPGKFDLGRFPFMAPDEAFSARLLCRAF